MQVFKTIANNFRAATRPLRRSVHDWRVKRTAAAARKRSAALIIAVTGSSAKSTTTALLDRILRAHGKTRGLVFKNTQKYIEKAMMSVAPDDEFVVVEAGVKAKGNMAGFTKVMRPDAAVVTLVGLEHYTAFRSREAVAEEKGGLVEAVTPDGFAVLNADDPLVMGMAARTQARIVTFGRENDADYRVTDVRFAFPGPLHVAIRWRGGEETVSTGLVGEHFWLPVAAAFAAAMELGVPVETIKQAASSFRSPSCRCEVMTVEDGPVFLVDTVKAPWDTIGLPLRTVENASAPKKRVVIGNISDYRGNAVSKYRGVYETARGYSDELIFVGNNSNKHRASAEDLQSGKVLEKQTARDVYEHLRDTATPGELILLKGSKNLHLERAALAFSRDVRCWEDQCGRSGTCEQCGLYGVPFEQHRALRRRQRRRRFIRKLTGRSPQ